MELNDYFNYFKFQKIENGGENDLLTWLSYELGKIDINDIKNSMYSIFNYLTQEQEDYINNLCCHLQEIKHEINYNIINYLKENFPIELGKKEQNNILNELKNLHKNSRIKFKQFDDNITIFFENNIQKLNEFIQNGKNENALNQINIIDNIKEKIKYSVQEIESIQNNHLNNCLKIIKVMSDNNYNNRKKNKKSKLNVLNLGYSRYNRTRFVSPINLRSLSNQSESNNYDQKMFYKNNLRNQNKSFIKRRLNHTDINYENNTFYINNSKEEKERYNLVKEYRNKIKEKTSEIEYLRELLIKEKDYRNIILRELHNIKYINKNYNNNFNNTVSILHYNNLSSKLNRLTDMIMNFSNSLRNFQDSIYWKSNNNYETNKTFKRLLKKLEEIVNLNVEAKQIENKIMKLEKNSILMKELNGSFQDLSDEDFNIKENKFTFQDNNNEITQNKNISFRDNDNIEVYNGSNLTTTKEKFKDNNNIEQLLNENKNLKSQIASYILSQDSKKKFINKNEEILKNQLEELKKDIEEKDIIIEILKKNDEKETEDKEMQTECNNENILNNKERENLETEIDFLNCQIDTNENEKIVKNIFSNIGENNIEEELIKLEVENENLKKELNSNNLTNQLKEKTEQLNILQLTYDKDINELKEIIQLLESNIEKLKQENEILINYNQKNFNKKPKLKVTSFNMLINPDIEVVVNSESNCQKEEINLLKNKNKELSDINKNLCEIIQKLKNNKEKEKEDFINLLRSPLEKFIYETRIDNKNKEFLQILLKLLDYTDNDIDYIFSIIIGKKKKLNFFSG